jgi:hypothetical protein
MGRPLDLAGQTFGRLTALAPTTERRRGSVVWRCRCACGREVKVPSRSLRSGDNRSCGCGRGRPPSARSTRLRERALRLRARGLTLAAVGERLGISRRYVHYLLRQTGRAAKGKGKK